MWSFVLAPIDEMIASLSGSTAVPAIEVFHALPAGNGRLIAPSTVTLLAAAALVVAFVAAADDEAAALGLGVALVGEDVDDCDEDESTPKLSCVSATCAAGCEHEPASRARARTAVVSTYSRGRRTAAG
jgi:hypothetical protein